MIPGSNLLTMALTLISKQMVNYYQYSSRTPNIIGQLVTTYNEVIQIKGSFQAVQKSLYEQYGLDLQKNFATFYAPANILDIQRDVSGDQIGYAGRRYQVESQNNWYAMDGWMGVLCVDIGADT